MYQSFCFIYFLIYCTCIPSFFFFFFFNDTATTEIYTLSLHDALPIWLARLRGGAGAGHRLRAAALSRCRSEEHTSELQSPCNLVCRLLLEKKKKTILQYVRVIHSGRFSSI